MIIIKQSKGIQKIYRQLFALVLICVCTTSTFAESHRENTSIIGVTIGFSLIAAGALYAVYHSEKAGERHEIYRNSAFTDNTVAFRKDVKRHTAHAVGGGIAAALGAVCVVVSF